jgi:transmembrane 9 superfamily member 3
MWAIIAAVFCVFQVAGLSYAVGNDVTVWVNSIILLDNPVASVSASTLFDCEIKFRENSYSHSFGETLAGISLIDSGIESRFKVNNYNNFFCRVSAKDIDRKNWIRKLIRQHSMLEFKVDNEWGKMKVGFFDERLNTYYLYTSFEFVIEYFEDVIVGMKVKGNRPINVDFLYRIEFTSSVQWKEREEGKGEEKFDRFYDHYFYYYLAAATNFMVFLAILRICYGLFKEKVYKDFEDNSWQKIESAVSKVPSFLPIFSLIISSGLHTALVILATSLLSISSSLYTTSSELVYNFSLLYSAFGLFAGFICGVIYYQHKGKRNWFALFLGMLFLPCFIISSIILFTSQHSLLYSQIQTIIWTIMVLVVAYEPLYAVGFVLGNKYRTRYPLPAISYKIHAKIEPPEGIRLNTVLLIVQGGLFPFLSIYPLFAAVLKAYSNSLIFSNYQFSLYLLMQLAGSSALASTTCSFFAMEYDEFRWHWVSFLSAFSISFYCFLYSLYLYVFKFTIVGVFYSLYYFTFASIISGIVGVSCGAIGYLACSFIITKTYINRKCD